VAGAQVELDEDERYATLRRAELLLAAGGDPRRELDLDDRAVTAVAADLDSEAARAQLLSGLEALASETADLTETDAARLQLLTDPDLAWRCFARALLADAVSD
jgi:GNAT superfamily N-acetyltransferase